MKFVKIAVVFFLSYIFSVLALIANINEGSLFISNFNLYIGSIFHGFIFDIVVSIIITIINKLFPRVFSKNYLDNLFLAVCASLVISVLGFLAAIT